MATNATAAASTRSVPLVVVEGNIGAGKTTLIQGLKEKGYRVFLEPTVTNPYLEKFYEDSKTYAFPLQMWMLERRFLWFLKAVEMSWADSYASTEDMPKGLLLDRSVYSDKVFAVQNHLDGNISEEQFAAYTERLNDIKTRIPLPNALVYLDVTAARCHQRVMARCRECEMGIPKAYLANLGLRYEELVAEFTDVADVEVLNFRTHADDDDLSQPDTFVDCADVAARLEDVMSKRSLCRAVFTEEEKG